MSEVPPDTSRPSGRDDEPVGAARGRALGHIVFNALLIACFAVLFLRAGGLPSSMWEPLGSGSFPRLVLGCLMVFNVALIVQQLVALRTTSALPAHAVRDWLWQHRLAFAVLALFAAYIAGLYGLGFRWSSLAFLLLTQILLGARRPVALLVALVIALACSFGLDWLFGDVFNIMLPRGAWT